MDVKYSLNVRDANQFGYSCDEHKDFIMMQTFHFNMRLNFS
jgi:hypothetical protein